MPTTAAQQKVTTGTAIKTLLQVQPSTTRPIQVVEWGISFDGSAAATPIQCELIDTFTVAATVTAHVASGITLLDDPLGPPSTVTLGTAATGYTSTAEGTITQTRQLDAQQISPTNGYVIQMPLGIWPYVPVSHNLRVRVTAPAAVNATCYVCWAE